MLGPIELSRGTQLQGPGRADTLRSKATCTRPPARVGIPTGGLRVPCASGEWRSARFVDGGGGRRTF
jgi:hypothetical protein